MAIVSGTDDNTLIYMMRQAAYPVGAVYLSVETTDPAKLLGGKWEQLSDIGTIHAWKKIKEK